MAATDVEGVGLLGLAVVFVDASEAEREAADVELREPLAEMHRLRVSVDVATARVVERGAEDYAVRPCMAAR